MRHLPVTTAAEALLATLRARGITHVLANPGTDFAPLIEGWCRAPSAGLNMPVPVAVTHESAAIGMAHGHYLATGRPLAVMFHTNVGLANALMGVINARTDQVPMLILSGRTPIVEGGRTGARDLPIHWGQEMRDQAGMLREMVKWDYELKLPEQVPELIDRALAIAMSPPMGPVYLALPREILCQAVDGMVLPEPARQQPAAPSVPAPEAIETAAAWLAAAKRPVIVTQRAGAFPDAFQALADFAWRCGIPVVEFWTSRISMAADHPMHAGFDPGPVLAPADCVLVLDSLVPWLPQRHPLQEGCRVIQLGPDPLFAGTPVRGFPADLTLQGDLAPSLALLTAVLEPRLKGVADRRPTLAARHVEGRVVRWTTADKVAGPPMHPAFVSRRLAEALPEDAVLVSELGVDPSVMNFRRAGSYFGFPPAGGLGFGLPAALGVKLAHPERTVIATVGDGSYLFANPPACHQLAEALDLPLLTIVMNNGMWNAVHKTTRMVYPDGFSARVNEMPLTSLRPTPDFSLLVQASRGHGRRVEDPDDLPGAIAEALHVVQKERRQALLDVVVMPA